MGGIKLAMALAVILLAVIACRDEQPKTPDVELTAETSVQATRTAEPATPTRGLTPTATALPMRTATPTATPIPTATAIPTGRCSYTKQPVSEVGRQDGVYTIGRRCDRSREGAASRHAP